MCCYCQVKDFNPRSHEGSDTAEQDSQINHIISIHAPTRGATSGKHTPDLLSLLFQSTLPRGERRSLQRRSPLTKTFQSTLPRGERQKSSHRRYWTCNFNPRSHEGSDGSSLSLTCSTANFNPRSHEGSDCVVFVTATTYGRISIHAPTRGATFVKATAPLSKRFQSTLPRGERHLSEIAKRQSEKFQSTLPRGERPCLSCLMIAGLYFNPRSHEGSDVRIR